MTIISNEELSTQAYKKVKDMIISGYLKPGQKIVQDKLAEELGISRTPLRSALQMLVNDFLIESLPKRGMIVKDFTDQEILEIYDCRIAFECMAVPLFTKNASQEQIDGLSALFKPFLNGTKINRKSYQDADIIFHDSIIKFCGNIFLYNLFQKGNLLVCIDLIGLVRPPLETLQEHLDIINAINERDHKKATKLMKSHLNISKELIKKNNEF
jgi:DNA-binding GntR family transcriptional regulator